MAYSVLDAVIDNLVSIDDINVVNNPSYVKALTYLYELRDGYEIPLEVTISSGDIDVDINYDWKED